MRPGELRHSRASVSLRLVGILALLATSLGVFGMQAPANADDSFTPLTKADITAVERSSKRADSKLDGNLQRLVDDLGSRPTSDIARSAPVSKGEKVAVSIRYTGDQSVMRGLIKASGADTEIANEADGVFEALRATRRAERD